MQENLAASPSPSHAESLFGVGEAVAYTVASAHLAPPLRRVRGHVLVAMQEALRARYASAWVRYHQMARDRGHPELASLPSTGWVGADAVVANDGIFAQLGLADEELVDLGRVVADRSFGAILTTMMRLSKEVGADAETALRLAPKIHPRLTTGSGLAVFRVGRRFLRLEIWNHPLAASRVHKAVTRGALLGTLAKLSASVAVTPAGVREDPPSIAFRIQY